MNNIKRTLQLLQEAPQVIEPLNTNKYKQEIEKYYKRHKSKFKPTDTEYLYKSGDTENGYYIFRRNESIAYFVRYKSANNILNKKAMRQILVQRFRTDYKSFGIPKKVFFDYLLPTFGGIVSDKEQTEDGKKFWEGAVHEALDNKDRYTVYVIDKRFSPNKIKEIHSHDEFDVAISDIWGESNIFQYILIAITLNK